MELRPVQFTYKNDETNRLHYGLIAEEVEEVYPELVVHDKDGESYSVRYHELPAMLLNELQKQNKRIQSLKLENSELKSMMVTLAAQVKRLESLVKNEQDQ